MNQSINQSIDRLTDQPTGDWLTSQATTLSINQQISLFSSVLYKELNRSHAVILHT